MKKFKLILLSLAVVASFALTACTQTPENNEPEEPTQTTEEKIEENREEYSEEGTSEKDSQNTAITNIGKSEIEKELSQDDDIESFTVGDVVIHTYDDGIVAQYYVTYTDMDGEEKEVIYNGYFVTIKQSDTVFKTYFLSCENMGENYEPEKEE